MATRRRAPSGRRRHKGRRLRSFVDGKATDWESCRIFMAPKPKRKHTRNDIADETGGKFGEKKF